MAIAWAVLRRIGRGIRWLLAILFMMLILRNSTTQFGEPYYALSAHVFDSHFDYIGWELGAIRAKVGQAVTGTHSYLTEEERSDYVRNWFADLYAVREIEGQIDAIYTDPLVNDPELATADIRAERDQRRADLRARQTMTEAILEGQVATIIVEEGFGIGGQLWPPVSMRFTGRTMLLVASPRESISMEHAITVKPIPVDERERIEAEVLADEDLSAVIVPIGGMALYPAMVVDTGSLSYAIETFAHEWFHHYLMFYPLGWETELMQMGEARIINETTASIFGREIAFKVMERYYPELVPAPSPEPKPTDTSDTNNQPPPPPPFQFDREMNITRVMTDRLLAKGKVEQAEAYMETRRELFVANGYGIRKINQAWFSFYGGYQVSGISAGGEDPIGPAIQQLRDESASIREWVVTMRTITSREALLATANPEGSTTDTG
jgi:hypothetical protein